MSLRKKLMVLVLMTAITVTFSVDTVIGREPPIPGSEKLVNPKMWAVGIVTDTGTAGFVATLRVKKIEGCNVDTDPQINTALTALPVSAEDILYFRLAPGSVFGLCPAHEPIITKVNNFKIDGNIVSFDCQIRFVVPDTADDNVCNPQ